MRLSLLLLGFAAAKDVFGKGSEKIASEFAIDVPLLKKILVPRVSGTPANAEIRTLLAEGWEVHVDEFQSSTPLGTKTFANVYANLIHNSTKKSLVLAAHFDSKFFKNGYFVGATDSGVPCSIILAIAKTISRIKKQHPQKQLTIMFFDGEEAFVDWTREDSLYGSRHLAQKFKDLGIIQNIELFLLLDLIGDPKSTFSNLVTKTQHAWDMIVDVEKRLAHAGFLSSAIANRIVNDHEFGYFSSGENFFGAHGVDDDHRPFMELGVPIVHVIPVPFPKVWHTLNDNFDAISVDMANDFARIFGVWVIEYLRLEIKT